MREQSADFIFDLELDGQKAQVEELADGALLIQGVAANLTVDDEEEAFEPGVLEDGVKALKGASILYHHRSGHALGQVLDTELARDGDKMELHVKGRIDKPQGGWADDVVHKIKTGSIHGLSVGGKFFKRLTENGWRIYKARLRELSVTPYSISPETNFSVVAGKAFAEVEENEEAPPASGDELTPEDTKALAEIDAALDEMSAGTDSLRARWASSGS